MALTYKVLGQTSSVANTDTTLYTVPGSNSAICSTITICNRSASDDYFKIAIRPSGASTANQHYIAYNTSIPANETISMTIGITLSATDVISVNSYSSSLTFNLFGSEVY